MGFGNLLKYFPAALMVGVSIGAYDLHKDLREIGDSMGNMVDMRTVGQLEIINNDFIEMHRALQDIHEGLHNAYPSLDSVVRPH